MSSPNTSYDENEVLAARVCVPESVVYREFAKETVVLNLETGLYHGLNPTAGRMLRVLDEVGSVKQASERLAGDYERPLDEIQRDMCALCAALLERTLLVVDDS